ncbi:hypothetical protein [uncultured Lamprocystis sp.]|jgi:hypothetical protein|nr:hypothetical protein [uncultured Lamprocystis sp.]
MELDANTRCYCLRRVNPFLGVIDDRLLKQARVEASLRRAAA